MIYELKRSKNVYIFGNVIALQIILRIKISGINGLFKVDLLQVPKIKYGYQIKKKSLISKINVACSNANLISLYYESWQVRNPGIFIIPGIFRSLEYSKVRRNLDPCQTYCKFFEE